MRRNITLKISHFDGFWIQNVLMCECKRRQTDSFHNKHKDREEQSLGKSLGSGRGTGRGSGSCLRGDAAEEKTTSWNTEEERWLFVWASLESEAIWSSAQNRSFTYEANENELIWNVYHNVKHCSQVSSVTFNHYSSIEQQKVIGCDYFWSFIYVKSYFLSRNDWLMVGLRLKLNFLMVLWLHYKLSCACPQLCLWFDYSIWHNRRPFIIWGSCSVSAGHLLSSASPMFISLSCKTQDFNQVFPHIHSLLEVNSNCFLFISFFLAFFYCVQ